MLETARPLYQATHSCASDLRSSTAQTELAARWVASLVFVRELSIDISRL